MHAGSAVLGQRASCAALFLAKAGSSAPQTAAPLIAAAPLPTPAHRCVFSTRISAYTACGCAWLAGSGSAAWQTCRGWQSGSNQGCGTVDICMQANAGQATAWIQAMCCSECAVRHAAARSAATLQLRNHSSPGSACCPAQSPGHGPASARTSERRPACGARAGEAVA